MWIAFNYCIFIVYDHNLFYIIQMSSSVVNCFQLLYFYRVRPQLCICSFVFIYRCELLSIIIFLSCTTTTFLPFLTTGVMLWIAFNYCIFIVYDHNLVLEELCLVSVVNCFQLLYFYRVRPQPVARREKQSPCCELLSIIVFLSCTTTTMYRNIFMC